LPKPALDKIEKLFRSDYR